MKQDDVRAKAREVLVKRGLWLDEPLQSEVINAMLAFASPLQGEREAIQGEWREIEVAPLLKGLRRSPKYYPSIGETCRVSGPNCDNEHGYTWLDQEVLWRDDLFIVTRSPGCWPTITKLELALFEPLALSPTVSQTGEG